MNIILLRTWVENIGNGFIDKGARGVLERAFPDSTVIETSGYPNLMAGRRSMGVLPRQWEPKIRQAVKPSTTDPRGQAVNIAEYVDADVAVLPGYVLYERLFIEYERVFKSLSDRDIPIILLGAGGQYDPESANTVKRHLSKHCIQAVITRDTDAYETYKDDFPNSYRGIDCGFFIDEWYQPPTSIQPFRVHTFDKTDEPEEIVVDDAVHASHTPFGRPHGTLRNQVNRYLNTAKTLEENQPFLSDLLTDYLFLYANADVTHSDRIHACVPTLAYGGKAQFWYDTPRGTLFDGLLSDDISSDPVCVDESRLSQEKSKLIENLREVVEYLSA